MYIEQVAYVCSVLRQDVHTKVSPSLPQNTICMYIRTLSIPEHVDFAGGPHHVMELLHVAVGLNQAHQHGHGGDEHHSNWR